MADDRAMRLYFDIIDFFVLFIFWFAWCLTVVGVISRMESGSDESILFTLVFFFFSRRCCYWYSNTRLIRIDRIIRSLLDCAE